MLTLDFAGRENCQNCRRGEEGEREEPAKGRVAMDGRMRSEVTNEWFLIGSFY